MTASQDLSRTYAVGKYRATFRLQLAHDGAPTALNVEWSPRRPTRLTNKWAREYRGARDEFMRLVGASIGGGVIVAEG